MQQFFHLPFFLFSASPHGLLLTASENPVQFLDIILVTLPFTSTSGLPFGLTLEVALPSNYCVTRNKVVEG
jgi:hypothetical protein